MALTALGVDGPKITHIPKHYSQTYDGESRVYMVVRYYAEPTTRLHQGFNLVKGDTPYPIFLAGVVRALIDTYLFFSGPNRPRRLGADVLEGACESGNNNHGEWGMIPSSLDLVVVSVPQKAGMDAKGEDLKVYEAFKKAHPTGFSTAWNYGGTTFLFLRNGGKSLLDGYGPMEGLECRI